MSEIRENQLTGEWVIIAPERAHRGGNLPLHSVNAALPSYLATCPFCIGNEMPDDIERYRLDDEDGKWLIRSLVNKYSVLSTPGSATGGGTGKINGVGLHEVIVENPLHNVSLGSSSVEQVRRVLEAYKDRFLAFYASLGVRHVIIFKNHGADAGASQQHSHSQIVGIPIVPGQIVDRLERSRRFYSETSQCLACTIIAGEKEEPGRIVFENDSFIAFIPHAALSPYHLWIFPKAHSSCFSRLQPAEMTALAEILRTVLAKVEGALSNPSFNLILRSLGPAEPDVAYFHWYISIVPRVNKAAGFELGTGMYVNPSSPEASAAFLRDYPV